MTDLCRPPLRPPWTLLAAVVLAHALLLGPAPPRPAAPSLRPAPAVQLRLVAPTPVATAAPPPVTPAAQPPRPATARAPARAVPRPNAGQPTPAPALVRTGLARPAAGPPRAAPGARAGAVAAEPAPPTAPAASPAHDAPSAAMPPAAGADASPAAAQLPPSATLDYRVSGSTRGLAFEAEAQLRWRRDGARYEAEWRVRLPLLGERTQRSEGALGAAGLAPERYAEQARGERAAHFDQGGGRIRFSANTPDAALQPGAQDRLSVSLQLGGLIAAAPDRYPPGRTISLQTAGVRDAEAWHWDVLADEALPIDGREVPCVKLVRQPRRDYDTRVELWLARPYAYLPARLRVTQANGDSVDQWLRALPPP